jgi:hypothetical protein
LTPCFTGAGGRRPEDKSFLQRCVEADGAEGLSQVADEVARLWARVKKAAEPNRSLCDKIALSFSWNKFGPQGEAKHRKSMNEKKAKLKKWKAKLKKWKGKLKKWKAKLKKLKKWNPKASTAK